MDAQDEYEALPNPELRGQLDRALARPRAERRRRRLRQVRDSGTRRFLAHFDGNIHVPATRPDDTAD